MVARKETAMTSICPPVTTDDPEVYKLQIEKTVKYAHRVHIDVSDGMHHLKKSLGRRSAA